MHATMIADCDSRLRLFLPVRAALVRYLLILVRDLHDAEDLAQEVASVVLGESAPPSDPVRFAAWCRGIARNLALKHLARKRRQPTPVELRFFDSVELCAGEQAASAEFWALRRRTLQECLQALPPTSRSVLACRYGGGESAMRIGKRIGQTPEAVRMLLYRIRQRLAQCVEARLRKDRNP
ncbi:MAG: sigma-70 family RNA polymerase sigma factor [Planctomycetes bacterium]|nr:sigma-70 family RNA polymerase sigma factor [Planctomycetota bacterium]